MSCSISFSEELFADHAKKIANIYGFVMDQTLLPRLELSAKGLFLLSADFSPLQVDFSRVLQGGRLDRNHPLLRASKVYPGMRVIDATAGWGQDAALLAQAGAEVLMLERQAMMAALLADGLERHGARAQRFSMASQELKPLALSLLWTDARSYLEGLSPASYPDLIYIDPMHPLRQKSALVKKDMQALQALIGADDGVEELILMAIQRVKMRVVVKWPNRLAPLIPPQQILSGKTVQYDIYPSLIKMHGF